MNSQPDLQAFHRPISKLGLLPASDLSAVFSNTAELLSINKVRIAPLTRSLPTFLTSDPSQEFLLVLESAKEAGGADPSQVRLGGAFLKSADSFKRYSRYFTDYVFAYSTVQTAIEQNSNFAAFLEENQTNPRLRGLKLDQFLIKPVQRICKYPLLLRVRYATVLRSCVLTIVYRNC